MAATFLSVPIKRTWEVDLVTPLRQFITTTYEKADSEYANAAVTEFNKLRNAVIAKSLDKHESALEVLYRYYDQLCSIEAKLPICENRVRVQFKWRDAFDKESLFSGKRILTIASASFEKVCILFCIAALQSQVGESQNHSSDDGLKASAKLFQLSAGIFNFLKDCVLSHVQQEPTPDLHPDTCAALGALMLAQAQDCFCRKAIADKMKPAVIAKLCSQCSDYYAEALKLLQLESMRYLFPKDWVPSVASKQAAYHALAEYHQSLVAKDTKDVGEELVRLRYASELLAASKKRGGDQFIFRDWKNKVTAALDLANKDNDFIYHARLPELSALAAIGRASPAKSLPLASPMSANYKDLFEKLVPLAVHEALQAFEARKSDVVNREIGRMREATTLMNGLLASLNLPAALEDVSGESKVPQSLLEKAAHIREMGGIQLLEQRMTDMPTLLMRNREILDEADRQMNEEEADDRQLREKFKERWSRTPSEKLTESLHVESSKYRTIINNAIRADEVVRGKFTAQRASIELMSRSDADIEASLPAASPMATLKNSPVVLELRSLLADVDKVKAEREALETDLKDKPCDMSTKFLSALAKDGMINESMISDQELSVVYSPLREQVNESLRRQETLLANIQRANAEFTRAKNDNQSAASREAKLKELAAAYDSYTELKSNIDEGTKFYNDLTQLLVKFQTKVSDLCFARKAEKEELMKDLPASAVNQPTRPAPTPPVSAATATAATVPTTTAAGGDGKKTDKQPPPRPPPPSVKPAAANQPPAVAASQTPAVNQSSGPAPTAQFPPYDGASPAGASAPPYSANGYAPYLYIPVPHAYNPYMQYPPVGGVPVYPPQQPPYGYYPGQGQPPYPQQPSGYPPQQPYPYQ